MSETHSSPEQPRAETPITDPVAARLAALVLAHGTAYDLPDGRQVRINWSSDIQTRKPNTQIEVRRVWPTLVLRRTKAVDRTYAHDRYTQVDPGLTMHEEQFWRKPFGDLHLAWRSDPSVWLEGERLHEFFDDITPTEAQAPGQPPQLIKRPRKDYYL